MKESPCIPLPDPVRENEVKLTLQWSADDRTTRAIMRQAQLTGMTPDEYLRQALAAVIAGNEEATFITEKEDFKIRADDAEKYVAAKLKGSLPDSIHCPHDVLSASGHQFDIKFSKLTSPNKSGAPFSRVWKWNRLLGDRRNKVYDRLILVGLATKRAQAEDRRDGREPRRYQFFDLSFEEAQTLAQMTHFLTFQVNTNRQKAHSPVGSFVWERHIEEEELVQKYSMAE